MPRSTDIISRLIEDDSDEFGPSDRQKPIDWSKVKFVKNVPDGAKRVHMYPVQDILRPRGTLQKESLSAVILEKLRDSFDSWTNPAYGDSISAEKLTSVLKQNLDQEVKAAWDQFLGS